VLDLIRSKLRSINHEKIPSDARNCIIGSSAYLIVVLPKLNIYILSIKKRLKAEAINLFLK